MKKRIISAGALLLLLAAMIRPSSAWGQAADTATPGESKAVDTSKPATPAKVDVAPVAEDSQIADRLQRILSATSWFDEPKVTVDQGVVFLHGTTSSQDFKDWAGQLATKTEDVVAVVNQIKLTERAAWDFRPAEAELRNMLRTAIQSLPTTGLSILLLVVTFFAATMTARLTEYVLQRRMPNSLLRQVAVRAIMVPVALVGIYLALRVSGLTQMAVTVLGGTGLAGLILGIAFQNIAENFLASILISMQRPFEAGDLIQVDQWQGYVQRVSTRGTVLFTLDGNHVQVPNAIIYKSVIRNFTANPNVRLDFRVGLEYQESISRAQEVAMQVLHDHPAVVADPEPLVLVEELADSKVYLRLYFWVDMKKHSNLKVRSAIMRLIKKAFDDCQLSSCPAKDQSQMKLPADKGSPAQPATSARNPPATESNRASVSAEGRLTSERHEIEQQASNSRPVEGGPDLLAAGVHNGRPHS
jgi:small-conductance mechanosensitive channel